MSRKRKGLTLEDQTLWTHVSRTIKPLGKERCPVPCLVPLKKTVVSPSRPKTVAISPLSQNHADPAIPLALPSRQVQGVRKVIIEARLDLHGMTHEQSRVRLIQFLGRSQQQQCTWVLVITGKGRPGKVTDNICEAPRKTLRELVPQWLNDISLKTVISAFAPAKPQDGGTGALYVRLKKLQKN